MIPEILYEDSDLLLCSKPAGIPSQPDPSGQVDMLTSLTASYPSVKLIHRLDTPTGGVMIFGLTQAATARLCTLVQDHEHFQKEYLAVLPTPPLELDGELRTYLFHDKRLNKSFAVTGPRRGAKEAILTYRVLATHPDNRHTLLQVRLHTGRTHQIRAQFASIGLPLVGDGKYGSREKCPFIALWSYRITLPHPATGRVISAFALPDTANIPWSDFQGVLHA